ncbi:MAG: homoserine kinase [Clostridium sp.]|uniref:homoserine kinase n=1 Tax=Clostridium sp. DSM 8431 TaxID=1761781 RepID=UPI0008EB18B3|nr:homoserine kinase [Clostridium sp. DSM 8431]MCR4944782.1 homoserine kinase [Clostridium sp.]SFU73340.1 homoserine kinase [Clostridium sp. DSM 8431]
MIKVRVPATSANMGPGFDSLGIALNLYNVFAFKEIDEGIKFKGFPEEFCNEDNIVYQSMMKCFNKAGYKPKGLEISALTQDIPVSRGLGSSSSCIVGGLVGANKIIGDKFSKDELLEMAVEIEGHPDNVAPALLGEMVVAILENNKVYYEKIKVHDGLKFMPIIPDFRLSTSDAREVLPKEISLKDGVYNVGRASLLVAAMAHGNFDLLKFACKECFHEKYRSKLIKGFDEVKNKAYEVGALGSYLSGAGPTIMAVAKDDNKEICYELNKFLEAKRFNWSIHELFVDKLGAIVLEGEE